MREIPYLNFDDFAARYCERQDSSAEALRATLRAQKARYAPEGWMLLECADMSSSRLGELTILVYGPNNTFKEPPDHPISPRGLASDTAIVVALLRASEVGL